MGRKSNVGPRPCGVIDWQGLVGGNWTVAEFCRREGVSIPSFYHWRKRLGLAAGDVYQHGSANRQECSSRRDTSPFVAVSVSSPAIAEIEFPNGVRIRVPATNARALRAAVRAGRDLCQAVAPC